MKIDVKKFGKNKYNQSWLYGVLYFNEFLTYEGLFILDKEYALMEDTTYPVKKVTSYTNKKSQIKFTIEL